MKNFSDFIPSFGETVKTLWNIEALSLQICGIFLTMKYEPRKNLQKIDSSPVLCIIAAKSFRKGIFSEKTQLENRSIDGK